MIIKFVKNKFLHCIIGLKFLYTFQKLLFEVRLAIKIGLWFLSFYSSTELYVTGLT